MKDTRTNNSFKNIIFSFGSQLINLILSFISRSVFVYCLGADYLGIQGLFYEIFNMLSLADLGFGTAMIFSMYKPLAEKDYHMLAGLTTFYKKVYRIVAIVVALIGIILVPFLDYIVKVDHEIPNLQLIYLLSLLKTIASYLVVYKTCIVNADQKSYIITKFGSIFNIISTFTLIIFLILTHNYIVYLCIQVLFTYITNFYSSHIASKMYPFINQKVLLKKEQTKNIFKNVFSAFLYKFSGVMINATDNTLISIIVNTATVGYYSNYSLVISKISGFVYTLFYSLTASLGNLVYTENQEKRYEIFQIMQTISMILSTFCVTCFLLLQQDLIYIWLGEEYLLDRLTLYAVVLNFYFSIVLLPIWTFREATGLFNKTRYVMLVTAILNLILSIILGRLIGLAGILFASSIAKILTYFWYEPKLLFKKYFGKSCLIYFLGILKSLGITVLTFFIVNFLVKYIIVTNWMLLIAKGFLVAGTTIIILLVFYRNSEGAKILFERIRGKLVGWKQKVKINT